MWHNLHRILTYIRFDIRNCSNKNNCYVIDAILDSFYKKLGNEELCAAILKRMPEWETHLLLYNEKNESIDSPLELELFFIKALELIQEILVSQNNNMMAYDAVDMLHCLPEIIVANANSEYNGNRSLQQYWRSYVEPFERKWNCTSFEPYHTFFCKHNNVFQKIWGKISSVSSNR